MPQPILEKDNLFLNPIWDLDERFRLASIQSIKRSVYYPTTPYGMGKFIQISITNEESPFFKVGVGKTPDVLFSTNEVKDGVLKMKDTITPSPNTFEDLLKDAILIWLSTTPMASIELLCNETDTTPQQIEEFIYNGKRLSFNAGFDIECFLSEAYN